MANTGDGNRLRPWVKAPLNFVSRTRQEGCLHSLSELVDFNAAHNASQVFCIQAQPDGRLQSITHGEFKVAVARCVAWLRKTLPPAVLAIDRSDPSKLAPVALLMPSDIGLLIYQFALISIQVPPLLLSLRLTPAAVTGLLQNTNACAVVVSPRLTEFAKSALAEVAASGTPTPVAEPWQSLYQAGADPSGLPEFEKPADLNAVAWLYHSSGTTGLPKPITITHRVSVFDVSGQKFDTEEQARGLNMAPLPLFHGFSIVPLGLALVAGKPAVWPAADEVASAEPLVKLIRETKARSLITVPAVVRDISNLPGDAGIKALVGLDFVMTSGAPLDAAVGDRLAAAGVKLLNLYGSSETGPLSLTFVPDQGYDRRFFRMRSDFEYRVDELAQVGGQRRFRLTVRSPGVGDVEGGYVMSDQLIRNEAHPETDFAAVGRDDTLIVLQTGLNLDPSMLEAQLTGSPLVRSALAFAETQFNLGVIVEPAKPLEPGDEAAFRHTIWNTVAGAGRNLYDTARVPSPDAIVIVPRGTTLPMTDKGTIKRKEAYALFHKEIEAVYERFRQKASKP